MLFCDLDGVLVNQTSRKRFDLMGWKDDGRALWEFIRPYRPTILSQLMADIYEVSEPEKRIWCSRELGPEVPVIVVRGEIGKYPHCKPGAILIDDDTRHRAAWELHGGIFVHHRTTLDTLDTLKLVL